MNLPNKLTVVRIILVPIIVLLYLFPYEAMNIVIGNCVLFNTPIPFTDIAIFIIFLIASFTDYLDGSIARKNQIITTFGKFMDPIADKLLVNTVLLLLASDGRIPVLLVIIIIARDTIVDAVRLVGATSNRVIAASFLGKLKTCCQMISIGLLLLHNAPFNWLDIRVDLGLLVIAAVVSVWGGVQYFMTYKDLVLESM